MAIAANYRKHPEAMALQLVLQFGRTLIWHTARPTLRILRAIRAERNAAAKAHPRTVYPTPRTTPQWVRDMRKKARELAHAARAACISIFSTTE